MDRADRTCTGKKIHLPLLLPWLISFPLHLPAQNAARKKVLTLYWYSKDFPSNIEFDRGIQEVLRKAGIDYYAEYLEPNRFPGEGQEIALRDYLRLKYSERKIDVVVAMSAVSADFLVKYRADLFPDAPIVFHTVTRTQLTDIGGSNATGVIPDNVHART